MLSVRMAALNRLRISPMTITSRNPALAAATGVPDQLIL